MKSVMLTIRLKWFYLTYKSIKTVEIRKSCPKNFEGDVFEVVSKTNFEKDLMEIPKNEREFFKQFKGKVGLKFTLNKVEEILTDETDLYGSGVKDIRYSTLEKDEPYLCEKSCLEYRELKDYLGNNNGYAWHISNLVIFDKPKELSEYKKCYRSKGYPQNQSWYLTKAPQSMCYIEVE